MVSTYRSFGYGSLSLVWVAVLGVIGALVPAAAQAQPIAPRFVGVSQVRTLTTYAYARDMDVENDTDDTEAAPDFGLFDASSRSSLNVSSAFAIATTTQRSAFSTTLISATGDAVMSTSISDPNWEVATARATSTFSISFRVNTASTVRLRGTLHSASPSASNGGKARIMLRNAGGTLFSQQEGGDPFDESFDTVVRLSAGTLYTIAATSQVEGTSNVENTANDSESAYTLTLDFIPTTATLGLMSLNRTISSQVLATDPRGTFGDDDTAEAPNAAAWSTTVRSSWRQGGADGSSRSRQDSKFNPNVASVTLQTAAAGSIKTRGESVQANANGVYEPRFYVGARTTVRLKGTTTRTGNTTTRAVLTDSNGLTLWRSTGTSFDQQVVLKPDRAYVLSVSSQSSAATINPANVATSNGTLTFTMTVVQP